MLKISDKIIQWVMRLFKNYTVEVSGVSRNAKIIRVEHIVSQEMLDHHSKNLLDRMAYDISKEMIKGGFVSFTVKDFFGEAYSYSDSDKFVAIMSVEVLYPIKKYEL